MFTTRTSTIALSLASALAAAPGFALDFNANIEFDTNYVSTKAGNTIANSPARGASQNGRVELITSAKGLNGEGFVAAKASFLANRNSTANDDDLWVQFGTKTIDLKLGRFEAADLFPLGRDTLVPFAGFDPYRGHLLRGRTSSDLLQAALTVNPTEALSFELGLVDHKADAANPTVTRGLRPVATVKMGDFSMRAGVEAIKYETLTSSVKRTGASISCSYFLGDSGSVNLSVAQSKNVANEKMTTVGLTGVMGAFGGGVLSGKAGDAKVNTAYVTYAMPLMGVKGATITPALAYSQGAGSNKADDVTAVRVRINYAF
ncbi:carbohydrate porin [Chitinimonas sp. PSY-7]|uniref:carbohydrate porin n=1 Tax=Chitinimonas sp. PSY-7 TaxID=3459088 RepID=UPI0040403A2B